MILYYQQILAPDGPRDNLESAIKLRFEMGEDTQLVPLPNFYCEKRILLGASCNLKLDAYLCEHKRIIPAYYDIYPTKIYKNILYNAERDMISAKKSLKPERDLISTQSFALNKMLIGTTLIPKAIADYIIDSDLGSLVVSKEFFEAWNSKKCDDCILSYEKIKKRRVVEQYLFLKYENYPVGRHE